MSPNQISADLLKYVIINHPVLGNICVVNWDGEIVRVDLLGNAMSGPKTLAPLFPRVRAFERGTSTHEYQAFKLACGIDKPRQGALALSRLRPLPLGTEFQLDVWDAVSCIPRGKTWTYAQVANHMGLSSKYARAVGTAVSKNPLALIIPCHRVHSKSENFRWGYDLKIKLLDIESGPVMPPRVKIEHYRHN